MGRIRVATFNAENLFARAENMPSEDHETDRSHLDALTELNDLIAKETYGVDDKAQIVKLVGELRPFIEVNEVRGRLLDFGARTVVAAGRDDWAGAISVKCADVSVEAQKSTAKVIESVDADVIALVEAHDRITLEQFSCGLLAPLDRYPYNMVIEGSDARGIDCGLLSRFPLGEMRTHVFDMDVRGNRTFSRDCMEISVALPNGKPLWLLINHFKSMNGGPQQANDARRTAQVDRVVELLRHFDLTRELVVVLGELNARPSGVTLQPLLRHLRLTDVVKLPANEQWSYRDPKRFEYMLVSESLLDHVTVGIERRGMGAVWLDLTI